MFVLLWLQEKLKQCVVHDNVFQFQPDIYYGPCWHPYEQEAEIWTGGKFNRIDIKQPSKCINELDPM